MMILAVSDIVKRVLIKPAINPMELVDQLLEQMYNVVFCCQCV